MARVENTDENVVEKAEYGQLFHNVTSCSNNSAFGLES